MSEYESEQIIIILWKNSGLFIFTALILDFEMNAVYTLRKTTKKCKTIVLIKCSFSLKKLNTGFSVISMNQRKVFILRGKKNHAFKF